MMVITKLISFSVQVINVGGGNARWGMQQLREVLEMMQARHAPRSARVPAGGTTSPPPSLPPPPRTNWTRRVSDPVLIGHAASLIPY